ncbi:MAG: HrcA family transcriptional regulator [Gammaproteobacteria bacterium SG8_30]|jgi:heat-inducible transcriptional repressor|nr:MAG: HrcA family transcriptional regulator [Gammaproteobacteria bacterium SG8_30]
MSPYGYATDEQLSERAQLLLKTLIENYIREGQPVGSRTLSRESGLNLSSATVRNVVADLEEHGFVASPHTSAGRVPTDKGYRFFVNTLLRVQPPGEADVQALQRAFESQSESPKALVATASQILSSFTRLAGVVMLPRHQARAALSQIEFLGLSENRILAILVIDGREVQNRIIQLDRYYSPDQLRRAANYLNENFRGRSLPEVKELLVAQMAETRELMNQLMLDAVTLAGRVFGEGEDDADVVIAGETNLMGFAELSNVERLRKLFEAFNEKRDILHLLDQSLHAEGVQIFIGHESGYTILDDCTVVTAPYARDSESVGVLGVIGPTRMAYERVIPIVDLTARLLGSALKSRS